MKIIQITATSPPGQALDEIYGLGDDGKVYAWTNSKWVLCTQTLN